MAKASPTPGKTLLTPDDHTLILVDHQSQMAFATKSIDAVQLRNNAALVASAAAGFGVPAVLTTVAEKSFSGPMFEEITDAFPGQKLLDRTSMNTWEDAAVIEEVNRLGKKRLVFCGLWTSVCIVGPTLSQQAFAAGARPSAKAWNTSSAERCTARPTWRRLATSTLSK